MYLEKTALDYFRKMEIRLPVSSQRYGNSPSRAIGRNLEFEQFSPYQPGNNIKDIDWKVFARSDKLFVRNYGSDLSTNVRIILDNSASFDFGDKLENAKKLTALFHAILSNGRHRVSFATINDRYQDYGQVTRESLELYLQQVSASGETELSRIPKPEKETRFLISDLWQKDLEPESLSKKRLHVIHLLSLEELDFSLSGNLELIDRESGERLPLIPSKLRREYRRLMRERSDRFRATLLSAGLAYSVLNIGEPYYVGLRQFLETLDVLAKRRGR